MIAIANPMGSSKYAVLIMFLLVKACFSLFSLILISEISFPVDINIGSEAERGGISSTVSDRPWIYFVSISHNRTLNHATQVRMNGGSHG